MRAFLSKRKAFPYSPGKVTISRFPSNRGGKLSATRVQLPKLGKVKYRNSQDWVGTIKRATVGECADGWYMCLCVETDIEPLPVSPNSIGVDVGIKSLLVTSNGESLENPKHLYKAEKKLKIRQRLVSRKKKGSANRRVSIRQ